MRLREERIDQIALAVVDRLMEDELVDLTIDEENLADLVSVCIVKDLKIDDEIQAEAVEWVRTNKRHLDEGSDPWSIEVSHQREQLAIRRGYVLP